MMQVLIDPCIEENSLPRLSSKQVTMAIDTSYLPCSLFVGWYGRYKIQRCGWIDRLTHVGA